MYEEITSFLKSNERKSGLIIVNNGFMAAEVQQRLKADNWHTTTGTQNFTYANGSTLAVRVVYGMSEAYKLQGIRVHALDMTKMHNPVTMKYIAAMCLREGGKLWQPS